MNQNAKPLDPLISRLMVKPAVNPHEKVIVNINIDNNNDIEQSDLSSQLPNQEDASKAVEIEMLNDIDLDPTLINFRERIKQRQKQQQQQQQQQQEPLKQPFIPLPDVPIEREEEEEEVEFVPKPRKRNNLPPKVKPAKIMQGISNIPNAQLMQIGDVSFRDRLPQTKDVTVSVPSYYMNNRKMFVQVVNGIFDQYKSSVADEDEEDVSCESLYNGANISLMTHQRIVRDYMNLYTPYRGLLLFHGLGAGKTCTSIGIAEGMKSFKKVLIMTPASLQPNYVAELKKCGDLYYKKQQYWEWISVQDKPSELKETLSKVLSVSMEFIIKNGGAWLLNVSIPESNYENLKKFGGPDENISQNQFSLNAQLDEMIKSKYTFENYNGLRTDKYNRMRAEGNPFSDKVVIIDEAHNLISRIVNQINKQSDKKSKAKTETRQSVKDPLSIRMYKDLMSAKNCKIILLSGTPIINYPNEIAIMFNILRGTIEMYEFKLQAPGLNLQKLQHIFYGDKNIDYMDYKPSTNEFNITRNPFGFQNYTQPDSNRYKGVNFARERYMGEDEFVTYIVDTLKTKEIIVKSVMNTTLKKEMLFTKKFFKALPDSLEEFKNEFINSQENNVYTFKNPMKFKYRIMGLTSYFRSAQEELLPRYDKSQNYHVVEVPMSDYQFNIYEIERHDERDKEKQKKIKIIDENGVFKDPTSTFKIWSRLACNFVEPREMKRPKPSMKADIAEIVEVPEEGVQFDERLREVEELEADEILSLGKDERYKQAIKDYVGYIKTNSRNILSKESLEVFSPKFLAMLNNIQNPDHVGLHLVYSQLRTIEGIELFSATLSQNGFNRFKIKLVNQNWVLDMDPRLLGTPMYALYTGTEDSIEREILRNIYNGSWKDVPKSLVDVVRPVSESNNMGQLIKVLMITSAGSEGINLLNTRYVHIMEPYWHPVRSEQVIGRARRICSHQSLPVELRTVDVFVYLMTLTPKQYNSDVAKELRRFDESKKLYYTGNPDDVDKTDKGKYKRLYFTSDQTLFEISNIKEELNTQLLKAVKESSIDCATHVKSSVKEQLSCLSFGKLSDNNTEYSYNPDIKMDRNDNDNQQNQKYDNLDDLKVITLNKIKYAYHAPTNAVYDYNSYLRASTTNSLDELIQVGRIQDGKIVR